MQREARRAGERRELERDPTVTAASQTRAQPGERQQHARDVERDADRVVAARLEAEQLELAEVCERDQRAVVARLRPDLDRGLPELAAERAPQAARAAPRRVVADQQVVVPDEPTRERRSERQRAERRQQ